tara:strand:+ start:239 stop:400 length:162 start_codon:yes stop_codon:yes gene_type:complete
MNNKLIKAFEGQVLLSESSLKDKAVMAALTAMHKEGFQYRSHPGGTWNISDRH